MPDEVEFRFTAPAGDLSEVLRLDWLKSIAAGAETRERLLSVYFDTEKFRLWRHGLSLRVRYAGNRRLQTIKATSGTAVAFGRAEWEAELDGQAPDLRLAHGTALAPLVKKSLPHALIPVFSTTVERTTLPIRLGDAELELALDRGRIAANGHGQPIDEIEIELKSGASAALADVAERLARTIPVAWQPRSKAERGYGLAAGTDDLAVRAAPIVLDPGVSTAGAARIIALSCLHHALANAAAVRDEQPQGVHQMRVGLRRLRAALSVFKDVLRDAGTDSIKTELKWLTEQLGPARDSYVLIEQRVRPLLGAAAFAGPAAVLERDLLAEHDANLCHAIAVIDSDRYRALGTRVALWLANGDWARTDDPLMRARRECPARDFAARCLQRRLRKILKKAKKIRTLQPRARHKLRIAVKKLRYATDFFASLFPGSTRKFRRRLKTVQSLLGTLNDSEVHKRLAATIVTADRGDGEAASKALAMGLIVGREDMTVGSCLAELEVAVPRLAKSPAFWR